jgi:hypothetical protein
MEASILSTRGRYTPTFTTSFAYDPNPENKGTIVAWVTDTYRNYNYPEQIQFEDVHSAIYLGIMAHNATKNMDTVGGAKSAMIRGSRKFGHAGKPILPSSYILNVQEEEFWSNHPRLLQSTR